MAGLEKAARWSAVVLAGLFIVLSLGGVFGSWFVSRAASDAALKLFGMIDIGVAVVDGGIARVDHLITRSRTEVGQAAETIKAAGGQGLANRPVLAALNERLETELVPRIAQMQQTLSPVREGARKVGDAVDFLSSLPMLAERAPRLAALDEAFERVTTLSADASQLRTTLRELAGTQNGGVSAENVAILDQLVQRIDHRLGEVQANVKELRADLAGLQARMDQRKSRLLFLFNLAALFSTLAMAWVIYTQIVVIQHHRARLRRTA